MKILSNIKQQMGNCLDQVAKLASSDDIPMSLWSLWFDYTNMVKKLTILNFARGLLSLLTRNLVSFWCKFYTQLLYCYAVSTDKEINYRTSSKNSALLIIRHPLPNDWK